MLLARGFSYADAHRARLGVNYKQIPVNASKAPVHSYSKDGAMRIHDPAVVEFVRTAYTLRPDDDDWGQAGTMVREVLDDAARARLVDNIVGHLLNAVSEPILLRAFEYWRNVDKDLGDRIEAGVRSKQDEKDPKAAEQANPARERAQAKA